MRKFMLILALCTVFAGCDLLGNGNSSTDAGSPGTSSSTINPAPTDTPTDNGGGDQTPAPQVSPTPTGFVIPKPKNCGANFNTDGQYGYIGDMLISQPHFGFLSYLGLQLPDNITTGQPYAESAQTSTGPFTHGVTGNPSPVVLANGNYVSGQPVLGYGYSGFVVRICNSSTTQSHTLNALGMQLASFSPDTAASVNIQAGCDSAVSAKQGPTGGCGGSVAGENGFQATWPSGASSGTQVTLSQQANTQSSGGYGNLPITLGPGKTYEVAIGMNYPGQTGTYTFQFGMAVDNVPMAIVGGTSYPLFMATHVHVWSGTSCYNNPAWKAIVLASTKWYICPAANF